MTSASLPNGHNGSCGPPPRFPAIVLFAMLLIAGGCARLLPLELMLYDFDEGVAGIYALQLAQKGIFPLVGVRTSLEFHNPPLFVLIVSIPALFSTSPVVATAFLQLLFLAALAVLLGVLWQSGWRWELLPVAAFAALSPGPVLLCGRLWGHALIPVFSIAAFVALLRVCSRPRNAAGAFLLPIAICCAQQVHFSGALLLFDAAVVLAVLRPRIAWRWLAAGAAAALLTYTPYLVHLVQTGFQDAATVLHLVVHGSGGGRVPQPLLRAALFGLADFGANTAFQQNYPAFLERIPWYGVLRAAGAGLFVLALIHAPIAMLASRGRQRATAAAESPIAMAALVWTLVPLAAFLLLRVETVPAYWLVSLPGPWLLAGGLLAGLRRAKAPCVAAAICTLLALVFSAGSAAYLYRHHAAVAQADPAMLCYPSYRDQRDAIRHICASSRGRRAVIRNEALPPNRGIPFQWLYLVAMVEGNATRFSPDTERRPDVEYLVHNRAVSAPRTAADELASGTVTRFGLLDVVAREEPCSFQPSSKTPAQEPLSPTGCLRPASLRPGRPGIQSADDTARGPGSHSTCL